MACTWTCTARMVFRSQSCACLILQHDFSNSQPVNSKFKRMFPFWRCRSHCLYEEGRINRVPWTYSFSGNQHRTATCHSCLLKKKRKLDWSGPRTRWRPNDASGQHFWNMCCYTILLQFRILPLGYGYWALISAVDEVVKHTSSRQVTHVPRENSGVGLEQAG